MVRNHETYSFEQAKELISALEVLGRDYELKREREPIEYENSENGTRIKRFPRVKYIIIEH